ncbi:MAG TPA: hypothetical protein VF791_17205 [Pyrinomonadaceae bacterium]
MLKKFRTVIFAILTVTLMGSGLAVASPKQEESRSFSLQGKVLAVDLKERTMSVREESTGREYTVLVPESGSFKISFGKDYKRNIPALENVSVGDIVRCKVRVAGEEDRSMARRSTKVTATKS